MPLQKLTVPQRPTHPVVVAGFLLFVAGLLGWMWTGEWRWAVTGLILLLAAAVLSGALDTKVTPPAA